MKKNKMRPALSFRIKKRFTLKPRGSGLLEILMATLILGLFVLGVVGVLFYGNQSVTIAGKRNRAILLAEESLAALQNIRDYDFEDLTDGIYGLEIQNGEWILSESSDTVDIYTREISITTLDTNRKEVTVTISWPQTVQKQGSLMIKTHITNWRRFVPTIGDWTNPILSTSILGKNTGERLQISGDYGFAVSTGSAKDFVSIDLTDIDNPFQLDRINLPTEYYSLCLSETHAFLVSTHNNKEVQITNITDPANLVAEGTYNTPGGANAEGVDFYNDFLFVVRSESSEEELVILDVTTPSDPIYLTGVELGDSSEDIMIVDNKALVSTYNDTQELQIVDIANPNNPQKIGFYDLPGTSDGLSVTGFGDTAIVGRRNGEIYIFDVSNPTNPVPYTQIIQAGGEVRHMTIGNNNTYLFLASSSETGEFQIWDIADKNAPVNIIKFDLEAPLNGVVYDEAKDVVFAVGEPGETQGGFLVIKPQ